MAKKKEKPEQVDEGTVWERAASAVVAELDYDMWKSLYVPDCIEDEEGAAETRASLADVIKTIVTSA